MHLLTPVLRDYAWGTTRDIPELLGMRPTGRPVAEAWWGAHDSSPSVAHAEDGGQPLDELIAADAQACLGADAVDRWGTRLPFLLKVLAIDKPLSIQVHPDLAQARAGFAREQRGTGGLPHTFQDPFHKPEMVVALSPMTVLAGVRPLEHLRADLVRLGTDGAETLADALSSGDLAHYMTAALAGAADDRTLAALADAGAGAAPQSSLAVAADALRHFPGDPGAMVALGLNVVQLERGESVYTGAGVLHSYQSGVGLEIMANSDNVVRAGLTPKRIDVPLLLELADPRPAPAARPRVTTTAGCIDIVTDAEEYALTVVSGAATIEPGPRIVLAVEGGATVTGAQASLSLGRGQAAFVRACDGPVEVAASGFTAVARLPRTDERQAMATR